MQLLVVGLNHKSAPVDIRERVSFTTAQLPEALYYLKRYALEGVVLSTCNRTEVYALVGHRGTGENSLRRFLAEYHGLDQSDLKPYLYVLSQRDAARHAFKVAAGLDSMIVGEPQILGQVRSAHEAAQRARASGRIVGQLFRRALHVGKRARTVTNISRSAASVSFAAVELARKLFGDLSTRSVLVVGAGEMGELTARTLIDHGAGEVVVTNRHHERAVQLAATFGGKAHTFDRLGDAISQADIVITSTGASEPVIEYDIIKQAMHIRRPKPLFLVDIAVPRDVAPEAAAIDNVYLYNIDDLKAICDTNLQVREQEAIKVAAIVDAEVEKFFDWWAALDVTPTIAALCQHADGIRRRELEKTLGRLGHLSERDRNAICALSQAIVNKLLHDPIACIKERQGERDYSGAVRDLFQLDDRDEPAAE